MNKHTIDYKKTKINDRNIKKNLLKKLRKDFNFAILTINKQKKIKK